LSGQSTIAQYFEAGAARDFERLAALRDPAWVAEWPQSGERVPSHEADRRIRETATAHGEGWRLQPILPVALSGAGDLWVAEARLAGSVPQSGIGIFELRQGKVWRETLFWAEPFDAPPDRAHLAGRLPSPMRSRIVQAAAPEQESRRRGAYERFYAAVEGLETSQQIQKSYLRAMHDLYTDDAIQEMPQSGEMVVGLPNLLAVVEGFKDFPGGKIRRIIGTGDLVVVEARLIYGSTVFWEVVISQFKGDRVCRSTEYYMPPFEAADWRRAFVERI